MMCRSLNQHRPPVDDEVSCAAERPWPSPQQIHVRYMRVYRWSFQLSDRDRAPPQVPSSVPSNACLHLPFTESRLG